MSMQKTSGFRGTVKKAVAVTSSVLVLMSGSVGVMSTALYATSIPVSAVEVEGATKITMYNEYGNNISTAKEIACYNSEAVGNKFTVEKSWTDEHGRIISYCANYRDIKVKLDKADELVVTATSDFLKAVEKVNLKVAKLDTGISPEITRLSDTEYNVRLYTSIARTGYLDKGDKLATARTLVYGEIPQGKYEFVITTEHGEAYRKFNLFVKEGTESLKVKMDDTAVTSGMVVIANHPSKLDVKGDSSSTDSYVYSVKGIDGKATTLAEISEDGVFTPKSNGAVIVTVSASDKKSRWMRKVVSREKAVGYATSRFTDYGVLTDADGNERDLSGNCFVYTKVAPKQFRVYIVKENPAKSIRITNAPTELKKGETVELKLQKVPTYNSDEYATSATDIIRWESSDTSVLKVDKDGIVTAVGGGTAKVRAYGDIEGVFGECEISVKVDATSVLIEDSPISVIEGDKKLISVKQMPIGANEDVVISSSDTKVAKVVKENGSYYVQGVSNGTAVLTVKTARSGVSSKATVTVMEKVSSEGMELSFGGTVVEDECGVTVGKSGTLSAKVLLSDGSYSSDVTYEVIENDGNISLGNTTNGRVSVKGVSRGTAVIRVHSNRTGDERDITVNVIKVASTLRVCTGADMTKSLSKVSLIEGSSVQLFGVLEANGNKKDDHDDRIVRWESSNTDIATVDENGVVVGVAEGTVKLTVYALSGLKKTITIAVDAVSEVVISNDNIVLEDGEPTLVVSLASSSSTVKLKGVVYNANGSTIKSADIVWSSSDTEVAEVKDGVLKVNGRGTAVIEAEAGGKRDSIILKVKADMLSCEIEPIEPMEYSPIVDSYTPNPVIRYNGVQLVEGVDYTLSYLRNTSIGNARVTVNGIGGYTGSVDVAFKISRKDISSGLSVSGVKSNVYTGSAVTLIPVLRYKGVQLVEGVDYSYKYSNNIDVGSAVIVFSGMGNYTGTLSKNFKITQADLKNANITLSATEYKYSGKECKPTVTVMFNGKKIQPVNYAVTYKNNVKAGTATVEISGKNNFKGTVTKTFTIVQDAPDSVRLNTSALTVGVGETYTLRAVLSPSTVTNKTVTWTSSNQKVATVSNGKVKAVGVGTAKITVKTANGKTAVCTLTVKEAPELVTASATNIRIGIGESVAITTGVNSGAAANVRTYSVGNENVISMLKTNVWRIVVTGKQEGTSTIIVKTYNGKTVTIKVTVCKAPTSVSFSQQSVTMGLGETCTLSTTVSSGTYSAQRNYTLDNDNLVLTSYGERFQVKANKVGTTKITVSTFNGKTAVATVTVKPAPTVVNIYSTSNVQSKTYTEAKTSSDLRTLNTLTVKRGTTFTLCSQVNSGAVCNTKTWSVGNSNIVSMTNTSANRQFKANNVGTTTISVRTYNGKVATCKVVVVV